MKKLTDLSDLELEDIYRFYDEGEHSLNKTCLYIKNKYDIKTNRNMLSVFFKRNGLDVRPPNGRNPIYNDYEDGFSRLAAAWFRLWMLDLDRDEDDIRRISALACVGSDVFVLMSNLLARNARISENLADLLPKGIKKEDVSEAQKCFSERLNNFLNFVNQERKTSSS